MDNNIKEFLQDVHFIAPDGYSIDYFILPTVEKDEIDHIVPFSQDFDVRPNEHKSVTTVFVKKPLEEIHSDPLDTQTMIDIPNKYPKTINDNFEWKSNENIITHGGKVDASDRIFKQINESCNQRTLILKERVGRFPRNTLFCFKKG